MKATCLNCGTDSDGDTCPICHKYDDSDYVMDDSKPPRVVALEKELASIMAVLPENTKPKDAPNLIVFFKTQMQAYSRRGIELEKELAEAQKRFTAEDVRQISIKLLEIMKEFAPEENQELKKAELAFVMLYERLLQEEKKRNGR